MRAFLAAYAVLLLCGAKYPAWSDLGVPLATERYAGAWARVQACSGRKPLPGHDLAQMSIIAVPHLTLDGHPIYAEWEPSDTIWIDESVTSDTSWIIQHELLHALLRGPSTADGGPHPLEPFAFPCRLMPWQWARGGIMGAKQ